MTFLIPELIFIALQFILFIPLYVVWKNDCKNIGKDRLAVSLKERFLYWVILFPLWIIPIMWLLK